jgi:hypothetical protein
VADATVLDDLLEAVAVMDNFIDAMVEFLASHDEDAASGRVCGCDACVMGRKALARARVSRSTIDRNILRRANITNERT